MSSPLLATPILPKHLLMVAYYFPPIGGAGAIRSVKFAKYLPSYGWAPYVLSVPGNLGEPQDPSLLDELPESVSVFRAWHLDPQHIRRGLLAFWKILWKVRLRRLGNYLQPYKVMGWLALPDEKISWLIPAYRVARRIIAQHGINAIYSTSPPCTSHLIGLRLKKATGLPWIADFRDEWTQNPFIRYPTHLHRAFNESLERRVLCNADVVTSVTEPVTQGLAELVPAQLSGKFVTLMNGYDEQDFADLRAQPRHRNSRFEIAHVGTLYGQRSARWLLEAVASLVNDGLLPLSQVHLQMVGHVWTDELAQYAGAVWFSAIDNVTHHEALRIMLNSDLLILLVNRESLASAPVKLFEYMAARRPLLAMAPEDSVVAEIVRHAHAGIVVPPDDMASIRSALLHFYRVYETGKAWEGQNLGVVRQYDRRQQAARLASSLDSLTSQMDVP